MIIYEKKLKECVNKFMQDFNKAAGLNIKDIEIEKIKPVSDPEIDFVAGKLITQEIALGLKELIVRKRKEEYIGNLQELLTKKDYLVTLNWIIQPTTQQTVLPEKKEWNRIISFTDKTSVQSFMLYSAAKNSILFDTIAFFIPTHTEISCHPLFKRKADSLQSRSLAHKIVKVRNFWDNVLLEYHYKALLTYDSFPGYCDSINSNNIKINIRFKLWSIKKKWYAVSGTPVAIIGSGGSWPAGTHGEGIPFISEFKLEVPTDYFSGSTLKFNDDENMAYDREFSFSESAGASLDCEKKYSSPVYLLYPDNSGNTMQIQHVLVSRETSPVRGAYYKKGRLQINCSIVAKNSIFFQTGRFCCYLPVYSAYLYTSVVSSAIHTSYWGNLGFSHHYIRGCAIPEPQVTISSTQTDIKKDDITKFNVMISNNSSYVSLDNITVKVNPSSLHDVLDTIGSNIRNVASIEPLSTAEVVFIFTGINGGEAIPSFEISYNLGAPVPQEEGCNDKKITIKGPAVKVPV